MENPITEIIGTPTDIIKPNKIILFMKIICLIVYYINLVPNILLGSKSFDDAWKNKLYNNSWGFYL